MKLSRYQGLRRRDLLQWVGGAALALPCLELFEREAIAQAAPKKSKYAVFCYYNDGVNNPAFWPTGGDPTNSPTLKSLAPYKDKVLVFGPQFDSPGKPTNNTGLTYNQKPAQHRANICLTASKVSLPLNPDQFHAVNKGDGPSIDWVIADALQKADGANATPYPYLTFGIHPIGGDTPSDITYDNSGNPIARMASAAEVTNRLFASMMMPVAGDPSSAAELRKLTAITDFLNARFGSLRSQLSAYDQQVLDHHLTSLRAYEDRKAKLLMMQSNPQAGCAGPSMSMVPVDSGSVQTGADTQFLSPFYMQSIATAFSCGMTKVATLSFGYPGGGGEGGLRMPWLGFTDAQHSVSHNGGAAGPLMKYGQMNAWTVSQVKFLMDTLAATPTPSGTLLDQTTIYLVNRHGDGNGHTNFALPNVILGGTGGYFKTGQVLSLPQTSPTKVLISIANAMGVDVPSFGTGAYADTNPLAGIAA
jgi:hypothetical protein